MKQYGRWYQEKKPRPNKIDNFQDCTIILDENLKVEGALFTRVKKSPANHCYFDIPLSLSNGVDDAIRECLRLFLKTIFAGNSDLALQSLVFHGVELSRKMLVLRGYVGDGKSAYSALRSNIFVTHIDITFRFCFLTVQKQ